MRKYKAAAKQFRLHWLRDCCQKSLAKKKVLDDQENSYNVFSGKVTSLTVKFRFEFLLY